MSVPCVPDAYAHARSHFFCRSARAATRAQHRYALMSWHNNWDEGYSRYGQQNYGKGKGKGKHYAERSQWDDWGHRSGHDAPARSHGKGALPIGVALERVQSAIREQQQLAQLSRMFSGADAGVMPPPLIGEAFGGGAQAGGTGFPPLPPGLRVSPPPQQSATSSLLSGASSAIAQVSAAVGQAALTALTAAFSPRRAQAAESANGAGENSAMNLIEKVGRVVTQSTSDAHPSVSAASPDNIYVDAVHRLRAENAQLRAAGDAGAARDIRRRRCGRPRAARIGESACRGLQPALGQAQGGAGTGRRRGRRRAEAAPAALAIAGAGPARERPRRRPPGGGWE